MASTEDDADTRDLLVLTLNLAGYEVVCTEDAEHAFDLIKKQQFDLYLLDNSWIGLLYARPDVSKAFRV